MNSRHLVSILVALWLPLAGCGQKGPLYLPGDPSEMRQTVPTTESAAESEDDESDDGREQR